MRITKYNSSIDFKAEYVDSMNIKKRCENGEYMSANASFVRIDCTNTGDISALETIAKRYWKDSFYANNIYNTAYLKHKKDESHSFYDLYALTIQEDKFEKLNPDKILGIVETIPDEEINQIYIEHIEADPRIVNNIEREYNDLGSSMLDGLKMLCESIILIARKSEAVTHFYNKNGFKEEHVGLGFFHWDKNEK